MLEDAASHVIVGVVSFLAGIGFRDVLHYLNECRKGAKRNRGIAI